MTTKTIGIKEFRAHISDFIAKAQKGNVRYIVMNRNSPLFEIKPFKKGATIDSLVEEIIEAQKDIKKGRLHSQEDVLREFL
jgi:antitoxin (DNA-binding transcriptional repressor) of toxin-antitoxin stability system